MIPQYQVSRDAARALEEFSDEFKGALALPSDLTLWAEQFGLVRRTDALKTTFPIPIHAAGYNEFKGDMKYRSLYHRSLSMTSKLWQDGVEEFAHIIETPDFVDWAGQPAAMALEWTRHPNLLAASMLAQSSFDGPLLDFYRDPDSGTASTRRLFADDYPANVLQSGVGTIDNTIDVTVAEILSGTAFDNIQDRFASFKGPNGKKLGLKLTGGDILAPLARANLFRRALENDNVVNAITSSGTQRGTSSVVAALPENNTWKKAIKYTIADELESDDYFYAIAAGRPGLHPWVIQVGSAPQEFVHDKNSEFYKSTLKVKIAYVGQANVAAALPHRIIRCHITG